MAVKPDQKIEDMIDKIRSGAISPASREGSDMIRKIALASPRDLTTRLFHLSNPVLEKAMKSAGMDEDQIEEILGTEVKGRGSIVPPQDPFAKAVQVKPEEMQFASDFLTPYEYDPGEEMRNGPRPPLR